MTKSWQERFPLDASLLPHLPDVANDQILLSRLTEADYRQASFLDQRIVTAQLPRQMVSWQELDTIPLPTLPGPHYIFHIGHVGSTLISRLLGEHPAILALREPQLLRTLCEISQICDQPQSPWSPTQYAERLARSRAWLSRVFADNQRVMIKASSFVSEMAGQLLSGQERALFLYVALDRYLPTILAGEASVQETQTMAATRLQRLNRRLGQTCARLWELSLAQRVAMSWLCELTSLMETQQQITDDRILWMDFDAFLAQPLDKLQTAAHHFGLDQSTDAAKQLISGPIMSSYSKAPEHDYSPDLRQDLLKDASQKHAAEIGAAMLWVEELASKHPLIADSMQWIEAKR